MKKLVLLLIQVLSTCYAQQPNRYFNSLNAIVLAEKEGYSRLSTENAVTASLNFTVNYYRCEWKVDPSVRFITGKVISYFIITSPADYISYDLTDSLTVDSVKQNNNLISFEQANKM